MKHDRQGGMTNYGVVNIGKIHGDVTNRIQQRFSEAAGRSANDRGEIRELLVELASQVKIHDAQMDDCADLLDRIGRLGDELSAKSPDGSIVKQQIDLIRRAAGKVPSVVQVLANITTVVTGVL